MYKTTGKYESPLVNNEDLKKHPRRVKRVKQSKLFSISKWWVIDESKSVFFLDQLDSELKKSNESSSKAKGAKIGEDDLVGDPSSLQRSFSSNTANAVFNKKFFAMPTD